MKIYIGHFMKAFHYNSIGIKRMVSKGYRVSQEWTEWGSGIFTPRLPVGPPHSQETLGTLQSQLSFWKGQKRRVVVDGQYRFCQ